MPIIDCAQCGTQIEARHVDQKYCTQKCGYDARKQKRQALLLAAVSPSTVLDGEKLCPGCHTFKPLIEFERRRLRDWGTEPAHRCRECHNDYMKRWYHDRPRTLAQRLRQVRLRMKPEWIIARPCKTCGLTKWASDFYAAPGHTSSQCRKCHNQRRADWVKANPEKMKQALIRSKFKGRYGLTVEERDALIAKQGGKCAICQETFVSSRKTHVDHCHISGKVRGVLCERCNLGVGNFRNNPDFLVAASVYLRMTA